MFSVLNHVRTRTVRELVCRASLNQSLQRDGQFSGFLKISGAKCIMLFFMGCSPLCWQPLSSAVNWPNPPRMIDVATGNIEIKNSVVAIGPSLTRDDFLASALGRNAQINVENGPHCSYGAQISAGALMSLATYMAPSFYHQQLESVSIMASDDRFGASWNDWSEEKERERKRFHDQWLADTIGIADALYPWGQLSSNYDVKSGCSDIHLRYSWQGKPWKPEKAAR